MECPVNLLHWRSEPDQDEISKCESVNIWQPVGFKGNRLQKCLVSSYFAAFSANRIAIDLQNPQNFFLTQSLFRCDSSSPTEC
jgi:hypothetical protein